MNFYLIEKAGEDKAAELLSTIKQFLKERLSGAIEDPVLKLAYDGINPFFLKTQAGIIWVRLFPEPLRAEDLPALGHELARASQMFHQKVRFYLFAPAYEQNLKVTAAVSQEILFFEYFFLKSRFGQGVALRECKVELSIGDAAPESSPSGSTRTARFKTARLDREELSDLIDLSLEFKALFKG